MSNTLRKRRQFGLTIIAPVLGFVIIMVLEIILKLEVSKLQSSLFNLAVLAAVALVVFPRWLGIPFGRISTREFLEKLGFTVPVDAWKHVVLGVVLAACTLSGMLAASLVTGDYVVDWGTVNVPHLVFSLNPALGEELFYRGVLMFLLLRLTRDVKKAALIQVALFGVLHIKGLGVWGLVDTFTVTVIAVGFTYVAYRTRSLLAGVVFHYIHDALLFLVQLNDGVHTGVADNLLFFGTLWLMVGVGCVVTGLAAGRFGVHASDELYSLEKFSE